MPAARRYVHLVQKPQCCAAACFQMLLHRRTGALYDQQELARFLGVKVDPRSLGAFDGRFPTLTSYNGDEGVSTMDCAGRVNEFFAREGLPLRARAWRHPDFGKLGAFLSARLRAGDDVWAEYHTDAIFPGGSFLHDSLVESVDRSSGEAILLDPEYSHKPRPRVRLENFAEAVSDRYGKATGFLVVSSAPCVRRPLAARALGALARMLRG